MVPNPANSGMIRDRVIAALLILFAVGAIAAAAWTLLHRERVSPARGSDNSVDGASVPPIPLPQIYKELAPEDARTENAAIPFSTALIERAPPLVLPVHASEIAGRRSSIDCLTAAIYYEAGQESEKGKRGVAQVVLNRVRHPAFPNSICDVVYQGSQRQTGCQFTFTCDGSLTRTPSRAGWEAARRIALAALSGAVEPSVGMATHYHADYVVPYWASSLAKIAQLDHHIFYRWTGGWGRRAAFTQLVSQEQRLIDQPQIEALGDDGFTPDGTLPNMSAISKSPRLLADENAGAPLGDAREGVAGAPEVSPIAADVRWTAPVADAMTGRLKGE